MSLDDLQDDPLDRIRALQSPETRARLDLMQRVKARFLRTQRYNDLSTAFQEFLDDLTLCADPKLPTGEGNRREGGAIVLVGESGAGKSLALKRLVARHPVFPGYCVSRSGCAAVYVRVPSYCTYKALGRITLRQLGMPIKGNPPAHIVWEKVFERLEGLRVIVPHFDEMHNVTVEADEDEIMHVRNMIKTLATSPTWPVVALISGLPELLELTQPITEIRRRCKHLEFAALRLPDDIGIVEHALMDMAGVANLQVNASEFEALIPRLIHAALYQLGTSIELSQQAISIALKEGTSNVAREHFATAFAARTGCVAPDNPFLAPNWADIDCAKVLGKGSNEIEEECDDDEVVAAERQKRKLKSKNRRR